MSQRTEPLRATRIGIPAQPAASIPSVAPTPAKAKRGWLPIDTVAVIVAAFTTFAVPYSLNQDGIALDGFHLLDVSFGVLINVGVVYLVGWPIRWAWHRFKSRM